MTSVAVDGRAVLGISPRLCGKAPGNWEWAERKLLTEK